MAIEIQTKNPTIQMGTQSPTIQMGIPGPRGERGPKGDPFTYDDFTPEQLEQLKGSKGDPFTYDDFTPEQLEQLKGPKGDKGDAFTYADFTPEQLEQLKGPKGDPGPTYTAGTNITISSDNVISATGGGGGGSYKLPVASYGTLGGIKSGDGRDIDGQKCVKVDSEGRAYVPFADGNYAGVVDILGGGGIRLFGGKISLYPPSEWNGELKIGGVKPDGTTTTTDKDGTIHAVMPKPYTLPTASTTTLGGVKVDGNTITIADGVISSASGGLIGKKMESYNQPESEWTWIADWAQHPEKYYVVIKDSSGTGKDCPVTYTAVYNNYFYYYWFEGNTLHNRYITFTDNTLSHIESVSQYADVGTVWLTEQNWNQYITGGGGGSWNYTTDTSNSDLYNAREVVIIWTDNYSNYHHTYLNVGYDDYGNSSNWGSSWSNRQIRLDSVDSSYYGSSITYDGNAVYGSECSINAICYKT